MQGVRPDDQLLPSHINTPLEHFPRRYLYFPSVTLHLLFIFPRHGVIAYRKPLPFYGESRETQGNYRNLYS